MRPYLLLLAAVLAAGTACSTKRVSITGELKYAQTAEENYQFGVEELKEEHWPEANKFFEYVRTKYPFSKYAALAELRQADAKFEQERYAEAAEAYQGFVQLHPTHDEVDYAEWRSALARFDDAPGDFFFFPPAYEKDQRALTAAAGQLTDFLRRRPDSKYAPEAQKLLAKANGRLAAHEYYVADFYWKREQWAGVVGRLDTMVRKYPGAEQEPDALLRLAEANVKLDERYRAQQALQRFLAKYPKHPRRPEAEKLLASVR